MNKTAEHFWMNTILVTMYYPNDGSRMEPNYFICLNFPHLSMMWYQI